MSETPSVQLLGPDLEAGIPLSDVPDGGFLLGQVNGEAVILSRSGNDFFAIGATCTHYGAPLAEGLIQDKIVRCPWHHARFDIRTGEAVSAPALRPLPCWKVEKREDRVYVPRKVAPTQKRYIPTSNGKIVIVGAGAAGNAAAEALRRSGYSGSITMIGSENTVPYDRPNLSKDYLAGTANEDWIPLRTPEFYRDQYIELILGARATGLNLQAKKVALSNGKSFAFDSCLLATGAEPVKLSIPGSKFPHVFTLRSLNDSRNLIERAKTAQQAVIIGASFIALEVASSLRARNVDVTIVAPEQQPLERIFGSQMAEFLREIHEAHGVKFCMGQTVKVINAASVTLENQTVLPADLVVAGIGVRPALSLAESVGLAMENGILVNSYLETSAPGIYAAGDIARWPDPYSGKKIRVEHWVVAERQGQVAALNMMGKPTVFDAIPFFWTQQYDLKISYIGHSEKWDRIEISGSFEDKECILSYYEGERIAAVATLGHDNINLNAEALMEIRDQAALRKLVQLP